MNQLFNIFVDALSLALLSVPLIWEVWNDKDGDAHVSRAGWNENIQMLSKRVDIYARCVLCGAASMVNTFLGHPLLSSIVMCGAIHFLFFDYIVAYVLMKNRVIDHVYNRWWSVLGSKGFDNFDWWKGKSWQVRMAIKVAVFIIACLIYF